MKGNLKTKTLFISLILVGIINAQPLQSAIRGKSSMTPLMQAAKDGNVKELKKLLRTKEGKATINTQDRQGNTALIHTTMAAGSDKSKVYIKIARALLKKNANANPNIRNTKGLTAYSYAEQAGDQEMMELLLCYHADTTNPPRIDDPIHPCDCP